MYVIININYVIVYVIVYDLIKNYFLSNTGTRLIVSCSFLNDFVYRIALSRHDIEKFSKRTILVYFGFITLIWNWRNCKQIKYVDKAFSL